MSKAMQYSCNPGYVWNPLLKYPRNSDCFCGSHLKFKKCCLSKVKPVVLASEMKGILESLRKGHRIKLVDTEHDPNANGVENEEPK